MIRNKLTFVALISLTVACEPKKAPTAPEKPAAEALPPQGQIPNTTFPDTLGGGLTDDSDPGPSSSDDGCRSSDCPKSDVTVTVEGERSLKGQVDTPVAWDFKIESEDYPTHELVIYTISSSPSLSGLKIEGDETKNARVQWTPQKTDPERGTLTLVVRDMTACEILNSDYERCDEFSDKETEVDTTVQMEWRVAGATGTGLLGGNGGSSGSNQVMMAIGLGALQGMLSGNGDITSIFNGALGGLSGTGGGLGGILGGNLNTTTPQTVQPQTANPGAAVPTGTGQATGPGGSVDPTAPATPQVPGGSP